MKARVLILRAPGTNCDQETVEAFLDAGASVEAKHIARMVKGGVDLDEYHILCIPGGFSYGDDLGAGKILACQLKYKLRKPIESFISEGKIILGICNGFQALVKAGLLPGFEGPFANQDATLALNKGGLFIDRWVYVKHQESRCKPLEKLGEAVLHLPVNHAEGRFTASKDTVRRLEEEGYVVFRYVDPNGRRSDRWNPNGSINCIAGICNRDGNVIGLMPHPEKYVHPYTNPFWTRVDPRSLNVDGLKFFKVLVEYVQTYIV